MTRPTLVESAARTRVDGATAGHGSLRLVHLRIALIALASLLPAAGLLGELQRASQLALVALPIATLGVMHGAIDPWVGEIVWRHHFGRYSRTGFFSTYLALVAAVVGCWILAPLPTLAAFLAISVLHFGEQDAAAFAGRKDALGVVVYGAIPVLGPVVGHPAEVATIFGWLIGVEPVPLRQLLVWVAQPLAAIWLVGAGMLVSRMAMEGVPDLAFKLFGMAVLLAAMLLLPPLIAFAAYFCLLHSFGHLFDMAVHDAGPWREWTLAQWTARLWPATLATLALGLGGLLLLDRFGGGEEVTVQVQLARIVFCGLAALTVPHVLLHEFFRRLQRD
ncbi:MAG: Brp/Blh family beta-carotene 15,15'-dioxygenase [Candidatus Wenzhouxiangella sp. M2_3B_020]